MLINPGTNLRSEIVNLQKRAIVYKALRVLLQEVDIAKSKTLLQNFVHVWMVQIQRTLFIISKLTVRIDQSVGVLLKKRMSHQHEYAIRIRSQKYQVLLC